MNLNSNIDPPPLAERLSELEIRYTHLQRTVEELNGVLIAQNLRLDQLARRLELLAAQFGALAEREPEPRSLEEEKPPHY